MAAREESLRADERERQREIAESGGASSADSPATEALRVRIASLEAEVSSLQTHNAMLQEHISAESARQSEVRGPARLLGD